MIKKKIFVLLPDGIGLRNFAFTDFKKLGEENNFDIIYWNNTLFDLSTLNCNEIKINNANENKFSSLLKVAKIEIGLHLFSKREKDDVYKTYRFPVKIKNLNSLIKFCIIKLLILLFKSEKGIKKINNIIDFLERKTKYYKECKEILEKENPSFIFCTNQRNLLGIAPVLAAKDLAIPTGVFIFSWDNMPKAVLLVETDYYFVWSNYMKKELKYYYSHITDNKILVTGSPQFEPHFDSNLLVSREVFFQRHNLPINKKYICFTGDDITSSPDDHQYLDDLAKAIIKLNKNGYDLGVIFRRCPVDFSNRYDEVLHKYKDLIYSIDPLWKPYLKMWNTIMPTKEDNQLLSNLAEHCEMVVNLGSTTVFDFAIHNKSCAYFNYNQEFRSNLKWDIFKCYKFVHFRSMPNKNSVVWFNNKNEIANKIAFELENQSTIKKAQEWFSIINKQPANLASERIWNEIKKIIDGQFN